MLFAPSQSFCESTSFLRNVLQAAAACLRPVSRWEKPRIQRKPLCLGNSPGRAHHLLRNQSWVWGCCCGLPELVSAARWKIPAWSEILFALASPLPEREAWLHTSVTALPRSKCGEDATRRLRGREGVFGLGVGTRSGGRIACRGMNIRPVARQVSPAPCAQRW